MHSNLQFIEQLKPRYQAGSRDYSLSFVVSEFATFISHDWQSSRWLKFLTLLWIFNLRSATITSLVVAVVWGSLMGLGLVPPAIWTLFIPWFVFFFVLCFWQRLRGLIRSPVVVFMDKLCISQDNLELKAKGIQGLGAFLDCSKTLTILWSPQYFTRLWCCSDECRDFFFESESERSVFPFCPFGSFGLASEVSMNWQLTYARTK